VEGTSFIVPTTSRYSTLQQVHVCVERSAQEPFDKPFGHRASPRSRLGKSLSVTMTRAVAHKGN
jgi:hypothetical protein